MSLFRKVTDDFSVAPQITVEDVRQAAQQGFRTLINNRPDGEAPDQTPGAEIEAAARAAGLAYHCIPVVGRPTPEQVDEQRAVLAQSDGPVLAYCRSGTRSIVTWAIGERLSGARASGELVALGREAGYDLAAVLG